MRGRNERAALRNLGTVLNQNCGSFATGFFNGGTRPWLLDSVPALSVRLVTLAQFDDQAEGRLAMGHRIEGTKQGDAHSIWVDPKTGEYNGAEDRRISGKAAGY